MTREWHTLETTWAYLRFGHDCILGILDSDVACVHNHRIPATAPQPRLLCPAILATAPLCRAARLRRLVPCHLEEHASLRQFTTSLLQLFDKCC